VVSAPDADPMILLVIVFLLVALAVLSVRYGADSRPLGDRKWGDQHERAHVARW
jgi:hypothetical protein